MIEENRAPSADPNDPLPGWDAVQAEIDRLISTSPEPFDQDTVANTQDLLSICRAKSALPAAVGKGYWSTFIFYWSSFEVEVFASRIEVYHFSDLGPFSIRYEEHRPGNPFTAEFLTELIALRRDP
jgi:hypothetical protein